MNRVEIGRKQIITVLLNLVLVSAAGEAQSAREPICLTPPEPTPISNVQVVCHDSFPPGFLSGVVSPLHRLCLRHQATSVTSVRFTVDESKNVGQVVFTRLGSGRAITTHLVNGALLYSTDRRLGRPLSPQRLTTRFTGAHRQAREKSPVDLEAINTALASPDLIRQVLECVGKPSIAAAEEAPIETCDESGNWLKDRFAEERDACRANSLTADVVDCWATEASQSLSIDDAVAECKVRCNCRCCKNPDSGCFCQVN